MSAESVPVSLLRQWAFCPRIPFIREVLGQHNTPPRWVGQGLDFDLLQQQLARDRRFRSFRLESYRPLRNVALSNPSLGLHGYADLVLLGDVDLIIGDYKLEAGPVRRGTRLQLAAYGLLAESEFRRPARGLMVISGKPMRVQWLDMNDALRSETLAAVDALAQVLNHPHMPASDAGPAKCSVCEHLNLCNDRE